VGDNGQYIAPKWPGKVFAMADSEEKLNAIDDHPGNVAHAKEDDQGYEKTR